MIGLGFWDDTTRYQGYLPSGDLPDRCFSLYHRNKAYTGSCIRIANNSGGAETDIGFVNGVVDTAAILSHVGSNTALVVTFYDQVGSNNLTRYSDNGYAPRIATGGSIITFSNGQPCIEFGQGTSGNLATSLQITTGDFFPSASSLFYTYQNSFSGCVLGGAGSATAPYHTYTENGQTSFTPDAFFDPNPHNLYINETSAYSGTAATADIWYDNLATGTIKLACETDLDLSLGNGYSIGMRGDNFNNYYRGKLSEMIIYNDVRTSTQVYDIMKILNKPLKAY